MNTTRKGTKLERWLVKEMTALGITSRRQPGSGRYSDMPHDNKVEMPGVGSLIVECKSWKNGWRTGDNAMGSAEMLVIKRDFGTPCVYLPWSTFKAMSEALAVMEKELGELKAHTQTD